jgi:hypothetical protein
MYGRFFLRVLLGLLVIAAVVGIGAYTYQMGVIQGAAQGIPEGAAPTITGPHFYGRSFHPFWGFGCFGLLIPLFFGGLRAVFWRGRWEQALACGHPATPATQAGRASANVRRVA